MTWLGFSYSLPSKSGSTPRVAAWRRLNRLGAVSPINSIHVLPASDDHLESLQWLAQEIEHAGGEVLIMQMNHFDNLTDGELEASFQAERAGDYQALAEELAPLKDFAAATLTEDQRQTNLGELRTLQRKFDEIAAIDYFKSAEGERLAAQLEALRTALETPPDLETEVEPANPGDFQQAEWVTRPQPHVDRLACIWLIRRFIHDEANIHYRKQAKADEVAFDMRGARFGHTGSLTTFETMLAAFAFEASGLKPLSQIVHDIDLRDDRYGRPETVGVDGILRGWRRQELSSRQLEKRGLILFDGLFASQGGKLDG